MCLFRSYVIFGIDLRPVFYGLVVCAFVGGALAVYDYSAFREKHELLAFAEKEISETIDHLPQPQNLIEEDYISIIKASFDDRMRLAFEKSRSFEEMTE